MLFIVEPSKVSVNIGIQIETSIGMKDDSFVLGAAQISNNGLDRGGVALLGIGRETSSLTDSVGDVWASAS